MLYLPWETRLPRQSALVIAPRILIFDEATRALDYESERAIQQNMKRIAAGRRVFVIAHRLSTVRQADRVITIEHGCAAAATPAIGGDARRPIMSRASRWTRPRCRSTINR